MLINSLNELGNNIFIKRVHACLMVGSHGLCGGRGPESSFDMLVHSEICQRESSASVLGAYFSMSKHGTPSTKSKKRTLVSQRNKRNFQGLLISTSSGSRDDSSHGSDLWKAECWVKQLSQICKDSETVIYCITMRSTTIHHEI